MAAQVAEIAQSLKMVAVNAGNPVAYLTDIITGRITRVVSGSGRVTISTSSGGSAASWTLPLGFNDLEMVQAAKIALNTVQTGVDAVVQFGSNGPSVMPAIGQQLNSERTTSYAQFGNIQH